MKYIVIESNFSYAVLLAENGLVYRSSNFNYQVGDIVSNPVLIKERRNYSSSRKKVVYAISVLATVLLFWAGTSFYNYNYKTVYSKIHMVINPNVVLEINKQDEVIAVEGTNIDGQKLLEGYSLTSKNKLVVIEELINRSYQMQLLEDEGMVLFYVEAPDNYYQRYYQELNDYITKNQSALDVGIIKCHDDCQLKIEEDNNKDNEILKEKSKEDIIKNKDSNTTVEPSEPTNNSYGNISAKEKEPTQKPNAKPSVPNDKNTNTSVGKKPSYNDDSYDDTSYNDVSYDDSSEDEYDEASYDVNSDDN